MYISSKESNYRIACFSFLFHVAKARQSLINQCLHLNKRPLMFSSNARITILTRQTGHIEDCRNFQEFNQHKKRADNAYFAGLPESFGEAYSWLPPRQILLLQTISLSTVVGGTYKVRRIQININYGHRRI